MTSPMQKLGGTVKTVSHGALVFIGFVATCAAVMLAHSLLRVQPLHGLEFVSVLGLAVVAARMKIKLPGLNGNMSVNLPFFLIAVAQLSLFEALLIALASTLHSASPRMGANPNFSR